MGAPILNPEPPDVQGGAAPRNPTPLDFTPVPPPPPISMQAAGAEVAARKALPQILAFHLERLRATYTSAPLVTREGATPVTHKGAPPVTHEGAPPVVPEGAPLVTNGATAAQVCEPHPKCLFFIHRAYSGQLNSFT
jgi:hypothetical protein